MDPDEDVALAHQVALHDGQVVLAGFNATIDYLHEVGGMDAIVPYERALGQRFLDTIPESVTVYGLPSLEGRVPDAPGGSPVRPTIVLGGDCCVVSELVQAGITDIRLELTTLAPRERIGAIAKLARTLEERGLKPA